MAVVTVGSWSSFPVLINCNFAVRCLVRIPNEELLFSLNISDSSAFPSMFSFIGCSGSVHANANEIVVIVLYPLGSCLKLEVLKAVIRLTCFLDGELIRSLWLIVLCVNFLVKNNMRFTCTTDVFIVTFIVPSLKNLFFDCFHEYFKDGALFWKSPTPLNQVKFCLLCYSHKSLFTLDMLPPTDKYWDFTYHKIFFQPGVTSSLFGNPTLGQS